MRSLNNLSAVLKVLTQNTPAYLPRFVYLRSYANITDGVSGLNDALANVGPISVSIDATPDSFYFYQGGLYYNADCKSGMDDLDHTVLAVGYTTVDGKSIPSSRTAGVTTGATAATFISRSKTIAAVSDTAHVRHVVGLQRAAVVFGESSIERYESNMGLFAAIYLFLVLS